MAKAGRPPKPEGTTLPEVLQIRLTADDKARWAQAAQVADLSLSEWIRATCNSQTAKKTKGQRRGSA